MTTATRESRAQALAADPGRWIPCTLTRSGATCFGIESQREPGLFHLAGHQSCSCPSYTSHQTACKHVEAVRAVLVERGLLPAYREPDGHSLWSRHEGHNGNVSYLPRRLAAAANAAMYDRIFGHD